MLRRLLLSRQKLCPSALQTRALNVHEYQGAELLRSHGVNVPPSIACSSVEEVQRAAQAMGGPSGEVVLKAQILAGGRGLGSFTNGLKGGVHVVKASLHLGGQSSFP
jgi:succinyl-CoA synthetase beta subunit